MVPLDELREVKAVYPLDVPEKKEQVLRLEIIKIYTKQVSDQDQREVIRNVLADIDQFKNLQFLSIHVSDTTLKDELKKCISKLPKLKQLQILSLASYTVDFFPKEIGELKNLKSLNLNVRLTELSADIGKLSSLVELRFEGMQFKTVPKEIGNLQKLEKLSFDYCRQVQLLPDELFNITTLKHLSVYDSPLKQLSGQIGNLSNLEYLFMANAEFTSIPKEIGHLKNIQEIWIEAPVSGFPEEISGLQNLKVFTLTSGQDLKLDKLFTDLSKIPALVEVNFPYCKINAIPKEVALLKNIELLGFDYCNDLGLTGIPEEIAGIKQLKKLCLNSTGIKKGDTLALRTLLPATEFYFDYRYCFSAGTAIALENGLTKEIELVEKGDKILAYNENTGQVEPAEVEHVHVFNAKVFSLNKLVFEVQEADGTYYASLEGLKKTRNPAVRLIEVEVTDEHPFLLASGNWKASGDLEVGSELLMYDTTSSSVRKLILASVEKRYTSSHVVYNLKSSLKTFVANGIIVHNK